MFRPHAATSVIIYGTSGRFIVTFESSLPMHNFSASIPTGELLLKGRALRDETKLIERQVEVERRFLIRPALKIPMGHGTWDEHSSRTFR